MKNKFVFSILAVCSLLGFACGTVKPDADFTASSTRVKKGSSTTLNWTVKNAERVEILPNIGVVESTEISRTVIVDEPITYTLRASSGDIDSIVTVDIQLIAEPPTISFSVYPISINMGETARLSWNVTNAKNLSITPVVSSSPAFRGEEIVKPTTNTTYTLTARNSDGETKTAVATLTVVPLPKPKAVRVYFETAKSKIASTAKGLNDNPNMVNNRKRLDSIATVLNNNPSYSITIVGNADERGSKSSNLKLSKERATAVERYLITKGVEKRQIKTRWVGDEYPLIDDSDEDALSKNRRTGVWLSRE